jgi:hypothetical protein
VTAAIRDAARIASAIQADNAVAAWLRDMYLRARSRLPLLRQPMAREASWSLGPGLFDEQHLRAPSPDRRNLLDQAVVKTARGPAAHLDDLLGDGFALLLFARGPGSAWDGPTLARWQHMDTRVFQVMPSGQQPVTDLDVSDPSGVLDRWRSRVGGADAAVIRPDRQVFGRYRGSPTSLPQVLEQARKHLAASLGVEATRSV